MRQICMSGSMSGVWKRSHGRTSEAPPDERGGNSYARPTATAPHSDSTDSSGSVMVARTAGIGATPSLPRVSAKAPFTIPFADIARRILLVLPTGGFFEFKTYALAGRLRASWMD